MISWKIWVPVLNGIAINIYEWYHVYIIHAKGDNQATSRSRKIQWIPLREQTFNAIRDTIIEGKFVSVQLVSISASQLDANP